jgi:hypothetical protein
MLNRLFFVGVLSLLFFPVISKAQSAVYFCAQTGNYGFCYGAASEMAARECAYSNCIKSGGTQPVIQDYTSKKGYGAVCIGTDYVDSKVIGVAFGYSTQDEADEAARQNCEDAGGYKIRVKEQWNDQ